MKEETLIKEFNLARKERLQNNQMIQMHDNVIRELQQFTVGVLEIMREMPGYSTALGVVNERRKEEERKAKEEAEAAKNIVVNEAEEISPEDLEAAAEKLDELKLGDEPDAKG